MPSYFLSFFYVLLGAFVSIATQLVINKNQEEREKRKNTARAVVLLKDLCNEIEKGMERSEAILGFAENNKVSYSKLFLPLWDTYSIDIAKFLDDRVVLQKLHSIYYRFFLINFNIDEHRPFAAAAFAKQYLSEIKENFEYIKKYLKDK